MLGDPQVPKSDGSHASISQWDLQTHWTQEAGAVLLPGGELLSAGTLTSSLSPYFSPFDMLIPGQRGDSKETKREDGLAILSLLALASRLRAHKETVHFLILWKV